MTTFVGTASELIWLLYTLRNKVAHQQHWCWTGFQHQALR